MVKNPLANAGNTGDAGSILGQEDPLKREKANHSSIRVSQPCNGEGGLYKSMKLLAMPRRATQDG